MRLFGLIGYPVSHSFSQKYFSQKFKSEGIDNAEYRLFPIEDLEMIFDFIDEYPELEGFSVTIPHKEAIIPYLDDIDDTAREIGAVNIVRIERREDGIFLKGYNSDIEGFDKTLPPDSVLSGKKALILGTGGASKAVGWVLKKRNIDFTFVSRNPVKNISVKYSSISGNVIGDHHLIINTTPLGMYPDINTYPNLPYEYISSDHILYDLVYNPENTLFLKRGIANGAMAINGLKMLYAQADKAWEIWNS